MILIVLFASGCFGLKPRPLYHSGGSSARYNEFERSGELSVKLGKDFNERLIVEAKKFLGVPYVLGGTDESGMDCSGFVMKVYRGLTGINLPHNAEMMYRYGKSIGYSNLKIGDLLFFKDIESRGISHVGIYIGDGKFIHSSLTKGVTISRLNERYYKRRLIGAKRVF